MDTRTGEIGNYDDMVGRASAEFLVEFDSSNLSDKAKEDLRKHGKAWIGPRDRCPCGSGKRFKNCCMFHSKPPRTKKRKLSI